MKAIAPLVLACWIIASLIVSGAVDTPVLEEHSPSVAVRRETPITGQAFGLRLDARATDPTISGPPDSAALELGHGGRRSTPTSASKRRAMRIAHGTLMGTAFVIIFPLGAILIRVFHFSSLIYVHAAIQVLGYSAAIAGLGIGVWLGLNVRYLDYAHSIIGMAVVGALAFQPILGIFHHVNFKRTGKRTLWSTGHVWLGRILVVLGIVNGGLGLMLAENTQAGEIGYGAAAGVMGILWAGVIVYVMLQRRTVKRRGEPKI